ncbi:hypothetical protein [Sulfobacillus thermosulfidooxidans]|uniref:hypothetical protein n=1 Tax=Sulfobacillus thermosulfidooxidans TaxID=28034 RepID=UPI000311AA19|nr:hypothetical protein [Sulfobacillus thermosulfidooxidans]
MSINAPAIYYEAANKILTGLGAPVTASNLNLLVAWMGLENGWNSSLSCHNPFNTTWKLNGSKTVNAKGVQCYPDWATGVQATINTLTQQSPSYATLVNALKNGDPNQFFSEAGRQELSVWSGGTPGYASTIHQIYTELGTPPASAMQSALATNSITQDLANFFNLKEFPLNNVKTVKQALGLAVIAGVVLALIWAGGDDLGL